MTDSDNNQEPFDPPAMETEDIRESLGDLLRQAREDKGLDVREAAEALKISADFLRALESERYGVLPGKTFIKGYLKGCARLLGLDEKDVLTRFSMVVSVPDSDSNAKALRDTVARQHNRRAKAMFAALSSVLLIVVAGATYWWQGNQTGEVPTSVAGSESALVVIPEQDRFFSEDSPVVGETSEQDSVSVMSEAESAVVGSALDDEGVEVAQPEPLVLIASVLEQRKKVATEGGVVSDEYRLVIRFNADCWVQVEDADDNVLFAELKRADSELDMTASKESISILFGDVSAVQSVYFNGKPVALDVPVSGEKVGRLKLG